ncbi:hypothetical protein DH2020_046748 [Rehmannia glutinosa]|uniref:CS domain-containing protein n=1 Tax=Rehmannia glutinosa TaxID=99300 RepID=A0ABR0UB34_REHGL
MQFHDDSSEVELRLELGDESISPAEIFVDANENSLVIRVQNSGYLKTLLDTNNLYGMIKPSETIWYIDDAQLVVNLKKQDPELKWPDIMESWESLSTGLVQLLKGTSVFLVGDSTEINQKIARELAVGLGYTPLSTKELLEAYIKQSIDSWVREEGFDVVAEAEGAILESLSSQARAVVATLGGKHGAARRPDKWQHLLRDLQFGCHNLKLQEIRSHGVQFPFSAYDQYELELSFVTPNLATIELDEGSAKEEAKKNMEDGVEGYSNAEVVVKLGGWDATYSKVVAQASLGALKRLLFARKSEVNGGCDTSSFSSSITSLLLRFTLFEGKKSLYIRLGCRGDWPDIKPPGWDPSTGADVSTAPS